MNKFSTSQYDPDAKFVRAQAGVPQGIKPQGMLPKMGRRDSPGASAEGKAPYTGSACPVCSQRFPDQPALIEHIENCAASRSVSPPPPMREAPQPMSKKAASLLRKVSEFTTNGSGPGATSRANLSGSNDSSGGFISGPTGFSHESHTTEGLVTTTPAPKKVPRKPAPMPPARTRSTTGGARAAAQRPVVRKNATRARSVSIDSVIEEEKEEEPAVEEEDFIEVVFHAGKVSLEAINGALRSRSTAETELIVIARLGKGFKRQVISFLSLLFALFCV